MHGEAQLTIRTQRRNQWLGIALLLFAAACAPAQPQSTAAHVGVAADFTLRDTETHNKFSRQIEPAIRVPSGSIIEAFTHEATGSQLTIEPDVNGFVSIDKNLVHTLTGRVYVEGAEPGDVPHMRVTMHLPKNIFADAGTIREEQ